MGNKYRIKFEYADAVSKWKWMNQECILYADNVHEARRKCIDWYGLDGVDCEYRIISIERIFPDGKVFDVTV